MRTLAVWEVALIVQSYRANVFSVGRHWPDVKVQAAINYAKAFPEEIESALSKERCDGVEALKRMLPPATEFVSRSSSKG